MKRKPELLIAKGTLPYFPGKTEPAEILILESDKAEYIKIKKERIPRKLKKANRNHEEIR